MRGVQGISSAAVAVFYPQHMSSQPVRVCGFRFKKIYVGKSQLHTQHIPRGITGEFDIMTCRDLGNGEVQYFRIRYD